MFTWYLIWPHHSLSTMELRRDSKAIVGYTIWLLLTAYVVLRGVSYIAVVGTMHPYEAASRWVYANIPEGASILGVHWDDKLPLHLPGFDPREYRYQYHTDQWELPLYEPDSEGKLAGMADQLSRADALIFPTQRLPGSVPRIPDELPDSTALLQLLFAEKLGYRLAASFKNYPRIGPWQLNDDTADESLSVYDHPKVTVFLNSERFSVDEIVRRVRNVQDFVPLPSLEEILLANGESTNVIDRPNWIVALTVWLVLILALGWLAQAFLGSDYDQSSTHALALSVGLLIPAFSMWFTGVLGVLQGGAVSSWFTCVLTAAALFLLRGAFGKEKMPHMGGAVLSVACVFLSFFATCLLIRAFQPEIYWGEKPMDSAFLHYFARGAAIPPEDPWAAGRPLGYYYFGSFLFGWLSQLSGVTPAVAYNLAVVTVQALLAAVVWSFCSVLTSNRLLALLLCLSVVMGSNLEWIHLVLIQGKELNFDTFWATSRLLRSPAISEYPGWSFLFADLHAHFIALPFVASLVGLLIPLLDSSKRLHLRWAVVVGLVWGSLFAINTWDFLAGIGLVLAFALVRLLNSPRKVDQGWVKAVLPIAAGIAGGALLIVGLFASDLPSGTRLHWGLVRENEFNSLFPILRHFGVWIALAVIAFISTAARGAIERRPAAAGIALALPPFVLELVSVLSGVSGIPWTIIVVCVGLSWMGAVWALAPHGSPYERSGGILVMLSGYAIAFSELVFLMDRMNTIFKVYNVTWLLLSIGSSIVLLGEISRIRSPKVSRSVACLATLVILPALLGGALNTYIMTTFRRVEGPRPTLDGQAYLQHIAPNEKSLIDWMNTYIEGTPTVLEAVGASYGPFSRIVMHTGLPTVAGWEHHLSQRGTPHAITRVRANDVRTLYTSEDIEQTRQLLLKYRVSFIVVSRLERETYGEGGLRKFEERPEMFRKLVSFGDAALYAVLVRVPESLREPRFLSY